MKVNLDVQKLKDAVEAGEQMGKTFLLGLIDSVQQAEWTETHNNGLRRQVDELTKERDTLKSKLEDTQRKLQMAQAIIDHATGRKADEPEVDSDENDDDEN